MKVAERVGGGVWPSRLRALEFNAATKKNKILHQSFRIQTNELMSLAEKLLTLITSYFNEISAK